MNFTFEKAITKHWQTFGLTECAESISARLWKYDLRICRRFLPKTSWLGLSLDLIYIISVTEIPVTLIITLCITKSAGPLCHRGKINIFIFSSINPLIGNFTVQHKNAYSGLDSRTLYQTQENKGNFKTLPSLRRDNQQWLKMRNSP